MSTVPHPTTIAIVDAKQRLLDWGEEADIAWKIQIEEFKASAQAQSRKILPWGAGIAAGVGVLSLLSLLRGKRKSEARPARLAGMIGIAALLVRGARMAIPILAPMIIARLNREKAYR